MKKQIMKGLYIGMATFILILTITGLAYLFTGIDAPFFAFIIDFLFFFSTMILFTGVTILITSAIYSISKEGYKKLFENNEKNS